MAINGSPKQLDFTDAKNRCPATVGFRLSSDDGEILASRAKALGVSVHDLARAYTLIALRDREERADLRQILEKLHQQLLELRKDLKISTAVLLSSPKEVDEDEALKWVEKNLGKT